MSTISLSSTRPLTRSALNLPHLVKPAIRSSTVLRPRCSTSTLSSAPKHLSFASPIATVRTFATARPLLLKDYFPEPDSPKIRTTEASWPHPPYSLEAAKQIQVAHREVKSWSDSIAFLAIRTMRFGMDLVTGYKHDDDKLAEKGGKKIEGDGEVVVVKSNMTERKWLIRLIFLESVAGVPGMVAGMLRHLRSLRRMQRDNGWIESLLEEAYNERMHLLTFLKMAEPGWFMKTMVIAAQGVFFNGMFLAYLISPRTCHRFVGYLEEEAVLTYTRIINDLEAGKLPKWEKTQAPDIAIKYWDMPEGHRMMRDLLYYVRADESKHREVNHTLANLHPNEDPNPFVSEYKNGDGKQHPDKGISKRSTGWEREECI